MKIVFKFFNGAAGFAQFMLWLHKNGLPLPHLPPPQMTLLLLHVLSTAEIPVTSFYEAFTIY
jgi:hypothetical protein